jgi:hypothetical protein
MNKHKAYESKQDLLDEVDPEKIMVLPFFIFKFYKTDKNYLRKVCRERFNWQQMENPYPARTTNCRINWLTTYVDLEKVNYSIYTDEYSGLILEGEITREQALQDLRFNPPPGLLAQLAKEIDVDLTKLTDNKKINVKSLMEKK